MLYIYIYIFIEHNDKQFILSWLTMIVDIDM